MNPNDKDQEPYDDEVALDDTAQVIKDALDAAGDEEDSPDGGLDAPMDRDLDAPDPISQEAGSDLINDVRDGKVEQPDQTADETTDDPETKGEAGDKDKDPPAKEAQSEAGSDTDGSTDAPKKNDPADDGTAKKEEATESVDLTSATPDVLLEGMADDRKAEVVNRLNAAAGITNLFKGREADLERMGQTPQGAVARLIELNDYATENPGEYLAWVTQQVSGNDPAALLNKAAEKFGLQVGPKAVEAPEGEFYDDATKAVMAENAALKAQMKTGSFGPDSPDRVATRDAQTRVQNFATELGDDGQLKRPFFNQLQPQMTEMARQHVTTTGRAVTEADLDRFYTAALQQAQAAFAPPQPAPQTAPAPTPAPSAAQPGPSVQEQIQKHTDAAKKAQRASKSTDGTGQGATGQPTLPPDADINDVIRAAMRGDG